MPAPGLPTKREYRLLRDLVDGKRSPAEPLPENASDSLKNLLGGEPRRFLERFNRLMDQMLERVVELNRRAIEELQLNVLVFPQGTRSHRLSVGHNGLAQVSQSLGAAIIPVGCNGSDKLYPGNLPLSKGGRVVYRVGKPLAVDGPELSPYRVSDSVRPLSDEAGRRFGTRYTAITEVVMKQINELLDPEYQFAEDQQSDGTEGVGRFV